MKRLIVLSLFVSLFFACNKAAEPTKSTNREPKVYICTGKSSEVYHSDENCRGLRNCKGEIKQVPLKEAQTMNRRACKICYGDE
jgi:hypothetical protein